MLFLILQLFVRLLCIVSQLFFEHLSSGKAYNLHCCLLYEPVRLWNWVRQLGSCTYQYRSQVFLFLISNACIASANPAFPTLDQFLQLSPNSRCFLGRTVGLGCHFSAEPNPQWCRHEKHSCAPTDSSKKEPKSRLSQGSLKVSIDAENTQSNHWWSQIVLARKVPSKCKRCIIENNYSKLAYVYELCQLLYGLF